MTLAGNGATVPIAQALQEGLFDGALLRWDRVVLERWGGVPVGNGDANPDGTVADGRVVMNEGRVSEIQVGRVEAQMKVKSQLALLDIGMPRNIWQPTCIHTLYDAGCTLLKKNFAASGKVGAGATNLHIPWPGSTASIYNQGTIVFGSGSNAGVKATVKQSSGIGFTVSYPLDYAPDEGDLFTIYQGCNKSVARCHAVRQHGAFPRLSGCAAAGGRGMSAAREAAERAAIVAAGPRLGRHALSSRRGFDGAGRRLRDAAGARVRRCRAGRAVRPAALSARLASAPERGALSRRDPGAGA